MKIGKASEAYSRQLNVLQEQRLSLRQTLKDMDEGRTPNTDRVEISKQLKTLDAEYDATQKGMETIMNRFTAIANAESAKQQSEGMKEAAEEVAKMMELVRRISNGDHVPPTDEEKLMKYSQELYMAAKNMAMLKERQGKDYDSLWEDEEEKAESENPIDIANESDIDIAAPDAVASQAAAQAGGGEASAPPPSLDITV